MVERGLQDNKYKEPNHFNLSSLLFCFWRKEKGKKTKIGKNNKNISRKESRERNKQTKPNKLQWNRGEVEEQRSVARGRKRGNKKPNLALKSKALT